LASVELGTTLAQIIIGRESELVALWRFLDSIHAGPAALLLSGDPGIGKTTVWKEGVEGALQKSYHLLTSRPVEAETRFSYAALGDLLEPAIEEALPTLPGPQRHALDVALLRAASSGARPNQRAVCLAVLGCLRSLASSAPVVVAIDDVQWIDLPSARVLQFVVRRLKQEPVGLLTAMRGAGLAEDPLHVASAFPQERVHEVRIGALSVDALDQVLRARLGTGFPRPTLLHLNEMSGGNPFFALEIGLALLRRGGDVAAGKPLPIPHRLQELIEDRLAGLPSRSVQALEVVSALSAPTLDLVAAAMVPSRGVDGRLGPAIDHMVVEVEGGRIRFTHPLFASAIYQAMPQVQRQKLHAKLAGVVTDPEERARHLALSVEGPDAAVSDALEEAARRAASRGAPQSAAELWEMARRATSSDRLEDLRRRTHEEGLAHFESGDTSLARKVLQQAVELSSPGPRLARALLDMGMIIAAEEGWRSTVDVFTRALEETGDELALRASIEQGLGYAWLFRGDVGASERHARAALDLAESLQEPRVLAEAYQAYPFVHFLLGRGLDLDMLDRGIALERHMLEVFLFPLLRPSFVLAQLLKYSDRLDAAREKFHMLLADAAERGIENPIAGFHYHLAELECRGGDWEAANEHAREAMAAAHQTGQAFYQAMAQFATGLVEAHLGRVDAARLAAQQGLRLTEAAGEVLTMVLNLSVLGFVELSLGNHAKAHRHLAKAIELKEAMGVQEPAYFRIVPDDVEALLALGLLEQAEALLTPFEEKGRQLDRAWALATAARCRALLSAARGDLPAALSAADEALREHDRLPLPFELGRTLLVKGAVERRAKRKREARETLRRALDTFEKLGAPLWAEKASAELARIGGRAPALLGLTPTEGRVAELVASGSTNREVADALFVSVHTVEANLKRIYRKLGIRSRTELASRFLSRPTGA
jgi:DNA-binding CsgD family transcriptional regulator